MSVLVCGSVAFDNIMNFHDRFKNHILPDKVHILSVAFLVPEMRQQFGGCAGNIAYSLGLLECDAYAMATVGQDFSDYAAWMDRHHVKRDYITAIEDAYTARAFVITDIDDNQITAFHPGAMDKCHTHQVPSNASITLGLISPEGREGMISHAQQMSELDIPFIFDPGQGLPMFQKAELNDFIGQAQWIACNSYESQMLCKRTGLTLEQLAQKVRAVIVTSGAEGSTIYHDGRSTEIPPVKANQLVDPTGCGDAYRAGLIYGICKELDWETTGRIASLMGAYKVECAGGQGHHFSLQEFEERFKESFGSSIKI